MEVDLENVSTTIAHVENCTHGETEGPVVNLSPHFVIDQKNETLDQSFSWMDQVKYIRETSKLPEPERPKGIQGPIILDAYNELGGVSNATEMWKIIKKGWSLRENGQAELSQKTLSGYSRYGYEDEIKLENILYDFLAQMLMPRKMQLFYDGLEFIKQARETNGEEFFRFREFYVNEIRSDNLRRYLEILSEYFKGYSEYDQAILYVKNGAPVPDGCIATSSGFKTTKMFYGNAFEHYTSNISTLACINNILNGRKFDQFKNMDLKKYLTINKANRANPIKENQLLSGFCNCLDSTLRNSSHHGALILVKKRRYIEYRSGGTGAKREMPYSMYIEMCNDIALTSFALLMLELVIGL
ncbi:hypothetical protein [Halomonas sp. MMSF_3323]|uniref:hypothetical protein n=1 Tax=Halomonas sp. MMSF_3323 TaxID=3046701 RepID=UPI00273EA5BE|nr:hypothetical protein [Halomonas sp. MMSF_3323]